MKTICIMCPVGCKLEIDKIDGEIVVKGNGCIRGANYGKDEFIEPKRVVTSLIKHQNTIYSVKTNRPIVKTKVFEVLNNIAKIVPEKEYEIGDTIFENYMNLGADLVVTGKNTIIK